MDLEAGDQRFVDIAQRKRELAFLEIDDGDIVEKRAVVRAKLVRL